MRVAQRLAGLFHSMASSAVRPAVVATWTPPDTKALQAPQAVMTSQQVPQPLFPPYACHNAFDRTRRSWLALQCTRSTCCMPMQRLRLAYNLFSRGWSCPSMRAAFKSLRCTIS